MLLSRSGLSHLNMWYDPMVLTVQIICHLIAKIDISDVSRRNADFGSCVFQICLKIKAFPLWKASLCPENNGKDVRMDYKVHWTRNNKEEIKFRLLSPKLYGQHKKRTLQDVKVHLDSPIYDFLCQNTATEKHRHSQSSPPLPHQDIEGRFKMPTA